MVIWCVLHSVMPSALQLRPQWKQSITSSQRHQAHLLLEANEAFTTELANARQQILEEMQQAIQGEAQEPQLLPSRVLMLSDHVCPRYSAGFYGVHQEHMSPGKHATPSNYLLGILGCEVIDEVSREDQPWHVHTG